MTFSLTYNDTIWIGVQVALLFFYSNFIPSIAASSIAREAETASILKMLPISSWQIVLGKLWISLLLPLLFFSLIEIIIGIVLQWTAFKLIGGLALKLILTIGLGGIGIWLGTIGAKYNPNNPQNRLTFGSSILMLIISYIYLFLVLIPFVLLSVPPSAETMLSDFSSEIGGFIGTVAYMVAMLLKWKIAAPILAWSIGIFIHVYSHWGFLGFSLN